MAKPFGKTPNNWLQLPSTVSYLEALINKGKSLNSDYQPVITYRGLPLYGGGTWFNEDVAIEFAWWLSPSCISWYKQRIKECGESAVEPETKAEVIRQEESRPILDMNAYGSQQQTMSSREIAQITGKEHRNVLRDCDLLNQDYEKLGLLKIEQGYYLHPNTGDQKHKEYLLNRMHTFDLMTGYSRELRIKVNRRWEELEKKQLDFSDPNVALKLEKNWKKEQVNKMVQ